MHPIKGKTLILSVIVAVCFLLSRDDALAQKKGDFVRYEQLIEYSIFSAQHSVDYTRNSHTISIFMKDGETVVFFEPVQDLHKGKVMIGGDRLELHFKEVEGGYVYTGGVIEK